MSSTLRSAMMGVSAFLWQLLDAVTEFFIFFMQVVFVHTGSQAGFIYTQR